MGMILRIASSRIVGQGDIVGRSGYFSLNLSANSVMRGRLDARRTLKSLVADLRFTKNRKAMIRLNVFIRTTDSNREELISTVKELAAASLKDEGCVAYDLFESATRRDVLMICETWSDAKALAAHEQASHFTTLVPRIHQLGEMKAEKFVF